ncbi:MAG: hypothetical protein AB1345_04065 [Chloroflexota bacterium]
MEIDFKSWGRIICGAAGAALAGPGGALIGNVAGGLLATVVPEAAGVLSIVLERITSQAIVGSSQALVERLSTAEKQRINHDLQTAFRDSFREALIDIGGEHCFPKEWREKQRDVPARVIYPLSSRAKRLWLEKNPLAGQICTCLQEMNRALSQEKILPLDPPADQPASSVYNYLEAESPAQLSSIFFDQVIAPFLRGYGSLLAEVPDLTTHLRNHTLDRTLVHLGEALKARTLAWRAFNRLMMEGLRDQMKQVEAGQEEILDCLDSLLKHSEVAPLNEWSEGMADLLGATGRIEKQMDEGFDVVLQRVVDQHREVLARFDGLLAVSVRIEEKVDRVLRILEDGRYVIEGTPAIPLDEPPASGEAPFKGLQFFDEDDAGLFFGREILTARLIRRLRENLEVTFPSGLESPTNGSGEYNDVDKQTYRFLAIIGASGSGKSSLVRAGLVPALRKGEPLYDGTLPPEGSSNWSVHVFTPTAHPLEALAASLTRTAHTVAETEILIEEMSRNPRALHLFSLKLVSGGKGNKRVLLVVDQFEELFTLCRSEEERKAFVDNLLAATSPQSGGPIVLVVTLRADFYAHCAQFDNLRAVLEGHQAYIGPMTEEELRRAIEQPARLGKWEFERGLVELILRDVGDEPGSLPLLSHALLETWEHRRGRYMTLESYAESGGVRGAIAKTAETVFTQKILPDQQPIARNILLRLIEPGEGTQATRRRATLGELIPRPESEPVVRAVLQKLVESRLVTVSEAGVEVAHEALIREWPRLCQWLDEDREGLLLHRRLTEAAQDWARLGQDTGAAYRGVRLAHVLEWAKEHDDQLSPLEREFVEFSRFVAERDAALKEAQRQRELEVAQQLAEEAEARRKAETKRAQQAEQSTTQLRQRNRVITIVGTLALVAAVVATIFGVAAGYWSIQSSHNAARAEGNLTTAQAASTQAVAEANTRATAEAIALWQKATAEAASAEALTQSQISLVRELMANSANLMERDPDLGLLLAIQAAKTASGLEATAIPEVQTLVYKALEQANFTHVLRGHEGEVFMASFSPDGKRVLTASQDNSARLWEVTGAPVAVLRGHTDQVFSAVFSPDGSHIVTASADGTARLWNSDGAFITSLEGHSAAVLWATFNPSGDLIITTSMDKTARLWQMDGTLVTTLQGHTNLVKGAIFSPDGTKILTISFDNTARLWALDGSLLTTLTGHTNWVTSASFSPDGSRILTGSYDNTARLWNTDGTLVAVLRGHSGAVYSVAFNPQDASIVTVSDDGSVRLWQPDGMSTAVLEGHTAPVLTVFFNANGSQFVTASADSTARLWGEDGTFITSLEGHAGFVNLALFSPDGENIVTSGSDGTVRLWRASLLHTAYLTGHNGPISWAGFSPDGKLVLTTGYDNLARLWNADGTLVTTLEGHIAGISGGAFSPDGKYIATASLDKTVRVWRTDGTLVTTLQGHTEAVRSVSFSPDSQWIATGSEDGTARLWRVDGTLVTVFEGHDEAIWTVAFSPDGKWLVTAGEDGTARLWEMDGTSVLILEGHSGPLSSASFSPDGQFILTASSDGSARLWRLDGTLVLTLSGHTAEVSWAAFSPDGSLIVTASFDGIARLWRSDGTFVADLEGHTDWIMAANFNPNGDQLITASWDGTARVWGVYSDYAKCLEEATRRVDRQMTPDECQQYLHQESCPATP